MSVKLKSGKSIPTRTIVWCAGIAPNPLIRELPFPTDERGYILTERDLRVKECENVWGIGDAAVNLDAEGNPYPATAQHAIREAEQLAENIDRVLQGKEARPCNIPTRGSLAFIGCRKGVAKIFGVKLSGFSAWWLYRTYYLLKMPGLGRRLRVALDWTLDLLFRREYVQLDTVRRRSSSIRGKNRTGG
jgi:NADH dehydrogenase